MAGGVEDVKVPSGREDVKVGGAVEDAKVPIGVEDAKVGGGVEAATPVVGSIGSASGTELGGS